MKLKVTENDRSLKYKQRLQLITRRGLNTNLQAIQNKMYQRGIKKVTSKPLKLAQICRPGKKLTVVNWSNTINTQLELHCCAYPVCKYM